MDRQELWVLTEELWVQTKGTFTAAAPMQRNTACVLPRGLGGNYVDIKNTVLDTQLQRAKHLNPLYCDHEMAERMSCSPPVRW